MDIARRIILLIITGLPGTGLLWSQNSGVIHGRVLNSMNNEAVPFANVVIWQTNTGATCDLDGDFTINNVKPGFVKLAASSIGYETVITSDIMVTNQRKSNIEIILTEKTTSLKEIEIEASPYRRVDESPVSLRTIGIAEIEKNPGGNRDISKIIQSYPGVASAPSFRNDVIVRGGGPAENKYYLDDIEIPNLNHFSTQGASGGPVGIINPDFIREIDFYSGAFPANRGNTLSSVINFRQKDGNPDKVVLKATIGASDLALSADGPLSANSGFVFSVRRSYLQLLFSLLGLPFLPTYNDYQMKVRWRLNAKNEISVISIGALDKSDLNTNADETEYQKYVLNYLPVYNQWNYTFGTVYKHFDNNDYHIFVFSRNYLDNSSFKYRNNIQTDSLKLLDYSSYEIENKFRYENNIRNEKGLKFNYGINFEYSKYHNQTYQKIFVGSDQVGLKYNSYMELFSWGMFSKLSRDFFGRRLIVSAGLRTDANNYSEEMSDCLNHFSPRVSLSFSVTERFFLNFNAGKYFQRPAYTTMGYRDSAGILVNKINGLKYIGSGHLVAGVEYRLDDDRIITVEGFYKNYENYPFSLADSVALANKGNDFGVTGDEEVISSAKGRAYGVEVYIRAEIIESLNTVLSYTFVRSEFTGMKGKYIPSAWDNRHLITITGSRNFNRNWQVGFKWRFTGGAPYTPYDENKSSIAAAWDARGRGYPDYSRFNSVRLNHYHQLDIRIDKEYYFTKWSLNFYVDIQNVYNSKYPDPDILVRKTENINGNIVPLDAYTDDHGVSRYYLNYLNKDGGTILPTIGLIVEF